MYRLRMRKGCAKIYHAGKELDVKAGVLRCAADPAVELGVCTSGRAGKKN